MSDLNKKNINYGALNRFYQDLKSHDLSVLNDKIDNIDVPEYVAGEGIAIDSAKTISCIVKPIADVSALPDAESNKDSVLRLNGDEQVYISKGTPITPTNRLPDNEQIDKAYLYNLEEYSVMYYKGEVQLVCSDDTLTVYKWCDDSWSNKFIFSLKNAENIDSTDYIGEINQSDGWVFSGNTATNTNKTTSDVISGMDEQSSFPLVSIPAICNKSENNQIDNAYITINGESYYYTGNIYEFTYWDDELSEDVTTSGYTWVNDESQTYIYITSKKASELYFKTQSNYIVSDCIFYEVELPGTDDENIIKFYPFEYDFDGNIYLETYQRTGIYQWQRVVTEDELDGIGDVFQALEARIYALEHPTTIE